ncbi:type II toxin-antitoxin system HicA family toxin [Avibacterium paragallinarum]|uniref:type II toxin-antitoxin system HicA family toxin n=1 Tax=Avibacterium paragallinarum TaxID=728 RepID=UPI0021F71742|nr:type II toxin-antitoxin system HicA family toxin [Avibacterium paragallinarum]UXN37546.1 type II toxin-antitoxin system HicA family toxin [Avibacterium paragallinarum]
MKQSEFVRWLKSQGVKVKNGTNHLKLEYQGNLSICPRHPSQELATGTMHRIKKDLKL